MNAFYVAGYVWLMTVVLIFQQFPVDEAAVRAAVLAAAYALIAFIVHGIIRLVRRSTRIGRRNLPKV